MQPGCEQSRRRRDDNAGLRAMKTHRENPQSLFACIARTAVLGGYTAAICGTVDVLFTAIFERNVLWVLPPLVLASYLVGGWIGGAVLGLRLGLGSPSLGQEGSRGADFELAQRAMLVAVGLYYATLVLVHRSTHVGIAELPAGLCVWLLLLWAVPAVLVKFGTASRRVSLYGLLVLLCAVFFHLGVPINRLYLPSLKSWTSLWANALLAGGLAGAYLIVRAVLRWRYESRLVDPVWWRLRRTVGVCLVGLLAACSLIATFRTRPIDASSSEPHAIYPEELDAPNVILIVMDTTRKDHLSAYGYDRDTTPNLRAFAQQAVRYTKAVSTSSWTLPAHASLFTGITPSEHQAHFVSENDLLKQAPGTASDLSKYPASPLDFRHWTLAEILAERGFRTAGVVSNPVYLNRFFGLHQGFKFYDDLPRASLVPQDAFSLMEWISHALPRERMLRKTQYRLADEINKIVDNWLDRQQEPFFLFINYMEPHMPYLPPAPYDTMYPGKDDSLAGWTPWNQMSHAVLSQQRKLTEREHRHLVSQYDGEITFMDSQIGILFERLRALEIYDRSLIVVTSDHGECFGEHDMMGHAVSLYNEELDIPLLIRYPGGRKAGDVDQRVSLKDVFFIILDELGISLPEGEPEMSPADELPGVLAELYRRKEYVQQWGPRFDRDLRAVFLPDDIKVITATDSRHHLYDLGQDPHETRNRAEVQPEVLDQVNLQISDWVESVRAGQPNKSEQAEISAEMFKNLRALGYVR